MYTGVRTATAYGFNRLAQNSVKCIIQQFLNSNRIRLYLPAMKIGTIVSQFNKIALFLGHVAKLVLIYDFRFTNYDLKVMFLTPYQDFGSNNFIFALSKG